MCVNFSRNLPHFGYYPWVDGAASPLRRVIVYCGNVPMSINLHLQPAR
jgi:hypothetical protein